MINNVNELISDLDQVEAYLYLKNRAMPDFVEPCVRNLLNEFQKLAEEQLKNVSFKPAGGLSNVLGWYSRKMAGHAVREKSITDLEAGLLASGIKVTLFGHRDSRVSLSLAYRSATHLNENPKMVFQRVAARCSAEAIKCFDEFVSLPGNQIAIERFGFSEGTGPLGFDYFPLLAEFGGPGLSW